MMIEKEVSLGFSRSFIYKDDPHSGFHFNVNAKGKCLNKNKYAQSNYTACIIGIVNGRAVKDLGIKENKQLLCFPICKGCGKESTEGLEQHALRYHKWQRYDHYGILTGKFCDKCYNSNKYPYRKDAYEEEGY